ncbi:MAG: hypothetical protein RLZ98_143 [Pseudomonadota bacterium]|jgi:DNA transformation protein
MPTSRETTTFIEDQLAGVGPVQIRRMFGGAGVFVDGQMFALIADDVLYLKVDDSTRADFEAEGSEAFTYQTKNGRNSIMSYWRAPDRLFEDADEMTEWARAALAVARRQHGASRAVKGGRKVPGRRRK